MREHFVSCRRKDNPLETDRNGEPIIFGPRNISDDQIDNLKIWADEGWDQGEAIDGKGIFLFQSDKNFVSLADRENRQL